MGLVMAAAMMAVPAYRGWQTVTQADGTTIEIQVLGDEYYHYTVNREGMEVRETNGMYEVVGERPSKAYAQAQRAKAKARRARKEFGISPNLAPKGIVLLVNFADTKLDNDHTQAVFDELCNSTNCTVNTYQSTNYPSAAEYFKAQSNGAYRPVFDVFGPVTLSQGYAFYGQNDKKGNDLYPWDAVIEGCILANEKYPNLNFADYDSDNDGYIDFVYVIYAGKGEANGGDRNTIWPHNWSLEYAVYPLVCDDDGNNCYIDYEEGTRMSCCYTEDDIVLDGKILNNYAMSAELDSRSRLSGIGTLCHEFGHVMGLPDLYDTDYGTNYQELLTPNEWDIMDGGSYNGGGHCPPNYDPWEKYFFGWATPVNYGEVGQLITLYANGTADYNVVQVNESGLLQDAAENGWCYYLENRQQSGWDSFVPSHGMVIWKVNYEESLWAYNMPNNTENQPRFTIVCSYGTQVGETNGSGNVFDGSSARKSSWTGVSGKPVKQISEYDGVITALYIEEPSEKTVTWVVNGDTLETKIYAEDGSEALELPTKAVVPCEGTSFIGWTAVQGWADPFLLPDDLFTEAAGKVTKNVTYYAVFE